MHCPRWFLLAVLCLPALASIARPAAPPAAPRVGVSVETSLGTASGQVRQFAFDGDPATYFVSARNAGRGDHFTLVLDRSVAVTSIGVVTGRPTGGDLLDAGALEVSSDGKKFEPIARFAAGQARVKVPGRQVRAIRIRPTKALEHPLVIREITVESRPALRAFRHPVEFVVNVDEAPEMKVWAEKAARMCERWYSRINEELPSPGFRPRRVVTMTMKKNFFAPAAASGDRIFGSVTWFKRYPGDVGAMIHETVHVVQSYRTQDNPGWLVEGIADYVRFFKYEPGHLGPISPTRARYDGSYRVTAAFLAYLSAKYDPGIVRKLNRAMREGEYREAIFKRLTGKTVQELGQEWQTTLRR